MRSWLSGRSVTGINHALLSGPSLPQSSGFSASGVGLRTCISNLPRCHWPGDHTLRIADFDNQAWVQRRLCHCLCPPQQRLWLILPQTPRVIVVPGRVGGDSPNAVAAGGVFCSPEAVLTGPWRQAPPSLSMLPSRWQHNEYCDHSGADVRPRDASPAPTQAGSVERPWSGAQGSP